MLTKDLSSLTTSQMNAISITIASLDDVIESATAFIKQGGQSYRSFLSDREQLITKICELPNCKQPKIFVLKFLCDQGIIFILWEISTDKTMQKPNRFDFEQQMMDCWGVVDDIKTIYHLQDLRDTTEDEMQNLLLGLFTMYQVKFEILQKMFEDLVHAKQL